jgi:CRISPR-associated protein Cas1
LGIAALLGPEAGFVSRTRQRRTTDPTNSVLDYLYGLLYTTCHTALLAAGLDPRLGFVHTDGPDGMLALPYDFIEEFRALGADRPALALLTRGSAVTVSGGWGLSLPTRRRLLRAFVRNLGVRCRYHAERRTLSDVIDRQARHLADVLSRAKPSRYRAFRYNVSPRR